MHLCFAIFHDSRAVPLVLFHGPLLLPIPYLFPITIAVGDPIKLAPAPVPSPTKAQVEEGYQVYEAAVRELYHKYQDEAGYGGVPIEFV